MSRDLPHLVCDDARVSDDVDPGWAEDYRNDHLRRARVPDRVRDGLRATAVADLVAAVVVLASWWSIAIGVVGSGSTVGTILVVAALALVARGAALLVIAELRVPEQRDR